MGFDRISVWFVCKPCQGQATFPNLEKFLSHKIDAHFEDFENAECIVFEESTNYERDNLPMRNSHVDQIEKAPTAPVHIQIKEEPQCIFGIGIDSDTEEPELESNTITCLNTEWVQDDIDADADADTHPDPVLDSADFINSSASVALIPQSQLKKPNTETSSFSKCNNNKPCPKSKKTNYVSFSHDSSSSSTSSSRDVQEIILPSPFECKLCYKKFSIEPAFRIHVTICQLYNGKKNIDQKVHQQQQPLRYPRPNMIVGPGPSPKYSSSSPRPEPDFLSLLQTISSESFKPGERQSQSSYIESQWKEEPAPDEKRKGRPYRSGISPQRKYKCTETDCGKSYCSKQNLSLHIKYNHNENNVRRFECKICRSRFNWKQCLKNHLAKVHNSQLSESEEQEFQRQEKFSRSYAHFRRRKQNNPASTTEPEPHFLSLLQTSFPESAEGKDEAGAGTEPQVKTKASKAMSKLKGKRIQRRKGRQYRWGVSPKRKYKCSEADCGKTYCAKQSLILHVKYNHTETNVRRFECKICHSRFNWKHVWKNHVLKVHNAEPELSE